MAALTAAVVILAGSTAFPASPATGLRALKQYAAPQAPPLVLAIVIAIGAIVALVRAALRLARSAPRNAANDNRPWAPPSYALGFAPC